MSDITNLSGTITTSKTDIAVVKAGEVWVVEGEIWAASGNLTLSFFDASTNTAQTLTTQAMTGSFKLERKVLESGDKLIAVMSTGSATFMLSATKLAAADVEGFTWRGAHVKDAAYAMKDVVGIDGTTYVSKQNDNTNAPPGGGWDVFTLKGEKGDAGTNGVDGKGDLTSTNNLSDLKDAAQARINLGFNGSSRVIGFGDLADAAIASKSEAETGTATNKLVTAKRVAEAVAAQVSGGGFKSIQVFDTAGRHAWTKPSGVNIIKVYVYTKIRFKLG